MKQEELQKALEIIAKGGITVNGDLVLSKQVENEIGNVEAGGIGIQNVYNSTPVKAAKSKKNIATKPASDRPKTLKYYTHGHNGRLKDQRRRVHIVFRLWNEWGWIDEKTSPDDFDAFFEGEPRHCNIKWTANSTILTILLQELLQQPYISNQTGCAAKSLVEHQFGKTPNSDRNRLDEGTADKIRMTLYILDPQNPLPERHGRNSDEDVDMEVVLSEIRTGGLRLTKEI